MSYHMFSGETHKCSKCAAFFLPFERSLPCPQCGTPSTEFYDFVSEAVTGLEIHKREYGEYTAGAYFVSGLPEHIFLLLCNAFDVIDGHPDFLTALREHLDGSDWGDQRYMSSHVYDIAVRVKERLAASSCDGD